MYKYLYTTSVFLYIFFIPITRVSQPHIPRSCDALRAGEPQWFSVRKVGSRKGQSNVVIFDWLSVDVTIVNKNCHYSLKHSLLHLSHLRNFLSYSFHTDVCRELSFSSRSIDSTLKMEETWMIIRSFGRLLWLNGPWDKPVYCNYVILIFYDRLSYQFS